MYFNKAVPVWAKEYTDDKNIVLSFESELDFKGQKAEIKIAADALYRLMVNGEFVCHGPQRCGRGFWRVDTIDLTAVLKSGVNKIAVWVARHGVSSFEYVLQDSFLQAEVLVNGDVVLATDINGDFTAKRVLSREQKVERYTIQRPFIEVWNLPLTYSAELQLVKVENIVLYDRTVAMPEFLEIAPEKLTADGEVFYKLKNFPGSNQHERPNSINFSYKKEELPIVHRDILASINSKTINKYDKSFELPVTVDENNFFICKFPYEDTGFLMVDVECETDSTVYFLYDEITYDGDVTPEKRCAATNMITFNLQKGAHKFTCLEPMTMHYIKAVCGKGKVQINGIKLKEYVNPEARKAKFISDDEALNRVFDAAVNTFAQNAVDLFTDCPSRERAGWLCDSFFTARVEKDLTGDSKIEKSFLENFFMATSFPDMPKNMLPMCYPSYVDSKQFIPNWVMFLVIQLDEYISRTGDREMLKLAKERIYGLEEYFKQFINADGLLENLKGWVFVEWSQANHWVQNINYPSNMMYYAMLKAISRMYGDKALSDKADALKETIINKSFNGRFFRDHSVIDENGDVTTPEDITEVCQYYAFFTGIADKETYPELLDIIVNDFGPGHKCKETHPEVYPANAFVGNYLRMEILSFTGNKDRILDEMKLYLEYMANLTGTLWEHDSTTASCNHGFASHAVRTVFRDCLGVDEVDEVNKKIVLSNDFCAPANAAAKLPLKNGWLDIKIADGIRGVTVVGDYKLV